MALTPIAKKKFSGQSGERNTPGSDRQEEPYVVTGVAGVGQAVATALAAAAAAGEETIEEGGVTLYQVGASWEFVTESTTADGLSQTYEVRLNYASDAFRKRDVGDVQLSYDTLGGSIHVTIAQSETVYPSAGSNTASFNNVIGNQGDSADGTDVTVPVFNLTVTKVFAVSNLPAPGDVFWLSGRYNAAPVTFTDSTTHETITFLAGEVTFKGARHPVPRADGAVEMTFDFFGSPNRTNITIAGITGIDKKGSQYVWVRYDQKPSGLSGSQVLVLEPKYVIVNDVIESGDFNLLRI
jgi:hypothetical protein